MKQAFVHLLKVVFAAHAQECTQTEKPFPLMLQQCTVKHAAGMFCQLGSPTGLGCKAAIQ